MKLFILLFLSASVLAFPTDNHPESLQGQLSDQDHALSEQDLDEAANKELEFLAQFRNYNDHSRMSDLLVPLLVQDREDVDATKVHQAVEKAAMTARYTSKHRSHMELLVVLLEPVLQPVGEVTLEALVRRANMEARAKLTEENESAGLAPSRRYYNDDWRMDDLVSAILSDGEKADPAQFNNAMERAYAKIVTVRCDLPQALDALTLDARLGALLRSKYVKTFTIRKSVLEARRTVEHERFQLPAGERVSYDVDARLSQELALLLGVDSSDVQTVVRRAREANTLELAVRERKNFALQKLVASGASYYTEVLFKDIYHRETSAKDFSRKDLEPLAILLRHPSISSEFFEALLDDAVTNALAGQLAWTEKERIENWATDGLLFFLLMTDPRATPSMIQSTYRYAMSFNNPRVLDAFGSAGLIDGIDALDSGRPFELRRAKSVR